MKLADAKKTIVIDGESYDISRFNKRQEHLAEQCMAMEKINLQQRFILEETYNSYKYFADQLKDSLSGK